MPREINLPQWGMAMNDGTVVKWLKNIGDQINNCLLYTSPSPRDS